MSDNLDKYYKKLDFSHANGILFIVVIWFLGINPILIVMTVNYLIQFLGSQLPRLGYEWIHIPVTAAYILMVVFILGSIVLSIGIYRLKKVAWESLLPYLIILQIFYWILIVCVFVFSFQVEASGWYAENKIKFGNVLSDLIFRFISSAGINSVFLVYRFRSRKAREMIYNT